MAQTAGRRTSHRKIWGQYRSDDLLVIDEAHHAAADGWQRTIKQWPGRIIGLTATPWRLSKFDGFDHLFRQLIPGPPISEMQSNGWLCPASVLMPRPDEIIRGGKIIADDYTEAGIEQANRDRPDVMTAGGQPLMRPLRCPLRQRLPPLRPLAGLATLEPRSPLRPPARTSLQPMPPGRPPPGPPTHHRRTAEVERYGAGTGNRAAKSARESELSDDEQLRSAFGKYISVLPFLERPRSNGPQIHRLYVEWENGLKQEFAAWQDELNKLESQIPDRRLVYNNARERVLQALESVAQETGLYPRPTPNRRVSPARHQANETSVKNWFDLINQTTEWLIRKEIIAEADCPVTTESGGRCLINSSSDNTKGKSFKQPKRLSNGLYLDRQLNSKTIARYCGQLLTQFGQNPAQFHVILE